MVFKVTQAKLFKFSKLLLNWHQARLQRRSKQQQPDERRQAEPEGEPVQGVLRRTAAAGTNCIKIGLPGKLILSKRKGLHEVLFSWKSSPRIDFPGRPNFIQLPPARPCPWRKETPSSSRQGLFETWSWWTSSSHSRRSSHRRLLIWVSCCRISCLVQCFSNWCLHQW